MPSLSCPERRTESASVRPCSLLFFEPVHQHTGDLEQRYEHRELPPELVPLRSIQCDFLDPGFDRTINIRPCLSVLLMALLLGTLDGGVHPLQETDESL